MSGVCLRSRQANSVKASALVQLLLRHDSQLDKEDTQSLRSDAGFTIVNQKRSLAYIFPFLALLPRFFLLTNIDLRDGEPRG